MKALSVRAPWWWFILHGGKDIENRDWYTSWRGTVLLHAGKWWKDDEVYYEWMSVGFVAPSVMVPACLTLADLRSSCGCIVGKADIVGCVSDSQSNWFGGKYGFVLANPMAFTKPIPFKGALGFFEVPDDIEGLQ